MIIDLDKKDIKYLHRIATAEAIKVSLMNKKYGMHHIYTRAECERIEKVQRILNENLEGGE